MPKKYSTPGVKVTEIDLSEIATPAGTSTGAIVITSPKGPVNRPVLVTNDKEFIDYFGEPVVSGTSLLYGYGAYAALEFLKESDALYVVRASSKTSDKFASIGVETGCSATTDVTLSGSQVWGIGASAGPVPDKVDEIYAIDNVSIPAAVDMVVGAISPGTWGNHLAVTVESLSAQTSDWFFNYDTIPSNTEISALTTSDMPIAQKVFKMNVYQKESTDTWMDFRVDKDGVSALDISPVETWYGTLRSQVDNNNKQLYIKDVVNGNSDYVYVDVNVNAPANFALGKDPNVKTSASETIGVKYDSLMPLISGTTNITDGIGTYYGTQWEYLKDKDQYDINIVIIPDYSTNVKQGVVQNLIGYRKDCIGVAQVGDSTKKTVQAVWAAEKYGYTDPSYIALYAGWDKVYDKYNDRYNFLPKCIFGAQAMARTDNVANVWDAPAGMSRGIIPSVDQNVVFNDAQIGQLYDRNINTSKLIRGVGNTLWGQKTSQLKKSALDRINVRRALNFIKKSIEQLLFPYVLDVNNTAKTRLRIWSNIDSFMATIQSEGGITSYNVVCDTSNNTPQIIDANQLAVDLYVQPVKTVEFISFQTIVTRTGVSIEEVRVR